MKLYITSAGDRRHLNVAEGQFVPFFDIDLKFVTNDDPARQIRRVYGAMRRGGMGPILARYYLTSMLHNQRECRYIYPKVVAS